MTDFEYMFEASSFNQDISNWQPSSAISMAGMFLDATLFGQDLCPWGDDLTQPNFSAPEMFSFSGCPDTSDPDLDASPISPLCYACNACFSTRAELDTAVSLDWTAEGAFPYTTYGPIEDWCFDANVDDFSSLFDANILIGLEDLNGWDVSVRKCSVVVVVVVVVWFLFSFDSCRCLVGFHNSMLQVWRRCSEVQHSLGMCLAGMSPWSVHLVACLRILASMAMFLLGT